MELPSRCLNGYIQVQYLYSLAGSTKFLGRTDL